MALERHRIETLYEILVGIRQYSRICDFDYMSAEQALPYTTGIKNLAKAYRLIKGESEGIEKEE